MQVSRNSKALAFGYQVTLRGALATMHDGLLLTTVRLYKIHHWFSGCRCAECKHNPFVQTAQDRDMTLTHHKV